MKIDKQLVWSTTLALIAMLIITFLCWVGGFDFTHRSKELAGALGGIMFAGVIVFCMVGAIMSEGF